MMFDQETIGDTLKQKTRTKNHSRKQPVIITLSHYHIITLPVFRLAAGSFFVLVLFLFVAAALIFVLPVSGSFWDQISFAGFADPVFSLTLEGLFGGFP